MARTWQTEELATVLAEFEAHLAGQNVGETLQAAGMATTPAMFAVSMPDPAGALRYLERKFKREVDLERMSADARALLSEIFNRWGVLVRRMGDPDAAVDILDTALLAADERTRQAICYNRGYARLQATVVDLERGYLRARYAPRKTVAMWRAVAQDLTEAAALDPADDCAWAQLGLVNLLLAATGICVPLTRRRAAARAARDAYARCLETLVAERAESRAIVEANQARAAAVEARLSTLPAWRRALGRAGEVSLELDPSPETGSGALPPLSVGPYR